jgi:hypothetical protein
MCGIPANCYNLQNVVIVTYHGYARRKNIGTSPSGCSHLDELLLPCSKSMWEAETSSAWESEYQKYLCARKSSEMLRCGHLFQMKESDPNAIGSETEEDLATWSKEIDDLGALLLMGIQT